MPHAKSGVTGPASHATIDQPCAIVPIIEAEVEAGVRKDASWE